MLGMVWIALELSIPETGNTMLSLTVKKLDAFKFDGDAESDNTGRVLVYNNAVQTDHSWKLPPPLPQ